MFPVFRGFGSEEIGLMTRHGAWRFFELCPVKPLTGTQNLELPEGSAAPPRRAAPTDFGGPRRVPQLRAEALSPTFGVLLVGLRGLVKFLVGSGVGWDRNFLLVLPLLLFLRLLTPSDDDIDDFYYHNHHIRSH